MFRCLARKLTRKKTEVTCFRVGFVWGQASRCSASLPLEKHYLFPAALGKLASPQAAATRSVAVT